MAARQTAKDLSQEKEKKAKAEFHAYKKRVDQAHGASPFAHAAGPAFGSFPPEGGAPWPFGFPHSPGAFLPGQAVPFATSSLGQGPSEAGGSLFDRLTTTVKLGIELLNSGLLTGTRLLQGIAPGPSLGTSACPGCPACSSSTMTSCCVGDCCSGHDCCAVMECACGCCTPSVGTCC